MKNRSNYFMINYAKFSGEVMAVLKLDNQVVAQTPWKQNSQQCWDQRMTFDLDRVSI